MVDAKERQAANRNSVQERQNPTGNGRLPPVFADLPPVGRTRPRSNSLPGAVNHEPIARPLPPVPPPAPGPNRRPMPGGMDGMYDDSDDDPVINNNDDEDFGMSPYGPRFDRRRSNTTTGRGRGGGQRMRQDRYRDDYDRSFDSPRMGGGRRPPPPDLPEFPPEPDFSGLPEYPGGHFRPVWRDGPFPGLWVPPPPPRPLFNQPTGVGSPKCRIPECMAPPYQRGAEYCNLAHRKEAVRRGLAPPCILCKENPKSLYQFCGQRCQDRAYKDAPLLLPIDKKDPKFNDIANQFNISWRHTNKQLPAVVHIYKVVMTKALMDSYDAYRKAVEKEGNFVSQRRSPGNECRRWHGTKRACTVGDDPKKLALCQQTTCALCSILRLSFLVTKTGSAGRTFNRFGIGVYATSTSSKSDDYQYNLCTSNYKVIMLTTVVVGRGEKLTQNNTSLAAPSKGYHSVLGETGKALNFDEVVVYNNDAIRPAWLVVYQ
ncbi:hypothetical protein FRB99_008798 [Tulasnella sp. 403]|nr:hypothetical protein FRB99_008798 [Tulasnella sp. 403]